MPAVTALVAEDETRLRDELCEALERRWPELQIAARAADGSQALAAWQELRPDVVFLDIQMPGPSGLEIARVINGRSHIVFVTAYDSHAVQAFEHGAVDYLLKPLDMNRLALTIERLKSRVVHVAGQVDDLLRTLASRLPPARNHLRWVTASLGPELCVITSEEICFFRAEHKYTLVATGDRDAVMTTPIRDLAAQLDPEAFWQIHRGTIVNIRKIAGVRRDRAGQLFVQLRGRKESLAVSDRYAQLFRQM